MSVTVPHPATEPVSSSALRATLAVQAGARTVRDVGRFCGWSSSHTAYRALAQARAAGLVDWEPDRAATLHLTMEVVDVAHQRRPRQTSDYAKGYADGLDGQPLIEGPSDAYRRGHNDGAEDRALLPKGR